MICQKEVMIYDDRSTGSDDFKNDKSILSDDFVNDK